MNRLGSHCHRLSDMELQWSHVALRRGRAQFSSSEELFPLGDHKCTAGSSGMNCLRVSAGGSADASAGVCAEEVSSLSFHFGPMMTQLHPTRALSNIV